MSAKVRHRLQSEWLKGHFDTTSVNLYTITVFMKFSTWSEKFVRVHKWLIVVIVSYTQATLQHISMSSVRIQQNSGTMRKFSRCESFPTTAIAKDLNIFRWETLIPQKWKLPIIFFETFPECSLPSTVLYIFENTMKMIIRSPLSFN